MLCPPCSRKGPLLATCRLKSPRRVKRETTNSRFCGPLGTWWFSVGSPPDDGGPALKWGRYADDRLNKYGNIDRQADQTGRHSRLPTAAAAQFEYGPVRSRHLPFYLLDSQKPGPTQCLESARSFRTRTRPRSNRNRSDPTSLRCLREARARGVGFPARFASARKSRGRARPDRFRAPNLCPLDHWGWVGGAKGGKKKKKLGGLPPATRTLPRGAKNHSTQDSHVVPHHGTNWAALRLTAQIGRDAVLSESYGRGCWCVRPPPRSPTLPLRCTPSGPAIGNSGPALKTQANKKREKEFEPRRGRTNL